MNVYLSYTRDLGDLADRLTHDLRLLDLEPIIDKENITPAKDWSIATEKMLRSADAFVFLVGRESTPWVEREWSKVVEESWRRPDAPMVPVVLEGCTPPAFLHERQAISLRLSRGYRKQVVKSIVDALHQKTAKKAAPSVAKEQQAKQRERLEVLKKQAKELQPNPEDLRRQAQYLETLLTRQQKEGTPKVAETATQLADVMKSLNKPDQILHYQQLALKSLVEHTGESHSDVARIHTNLATSLESRERRSEALEHFEKALEIYKETMGPDTMAVAMTEMRLAGMLRKMGQANAAKAHERAGQKALKAASLSFFTGLPIIGPIIKHFAEQVGKREKKARKKSAAKKKKVARKSTTVKKKSTKKKASLKKPASRKKGAAKRDGRRQ